MCLTPRWVTAGGESTVPSSPFAVPGRDVFGPRSLRQLWGLAVRCEQAMRAVAPGWLAQKDSWGEAACLFERLTFPATWLCQFAAAESVDAQPLPEPIIQLLASSVATVLKVARTAGINADFLLHFDFVNIPALRQCTTGALPAATISLLLSRMALVNRATAELLRYSGTTQTARREAHFSVGSLSQYAAYISSQSALRMSAHCGSAPSAGSSLMRDLLACPLLHLLYSPLLDTLVALQHVMVETLTTLQQCWESDEEVSDICRMHHTPASMDPDAMDSQVAMQVSHTDHSRGHAYRSHLLL